MQITFLGGVGSVTGSKYLVDVPGHRILHLFAPDERNSIVLAEFQAAGTRGAAMLSGATQVEFHGGYAPIRAEVSNLTKLSALADADEIMGFLRSAETAPRMTFVTHDEPNAANTLRHRIEEELNWPVRVPDYRDTATTG